VIISRLQRFYGVKDVTPECIAKIKDRLLAVRRDVSAATDTKTNMLSGGVGAVTWRADAPCVLPVSD